ncbi:uncharacterized protein [Euwallacea fornicatus]|uniref:uncharacterized protein n=1 Tax=Euwallacea fornicatus TaxID=995702 RepID=UPI0033904182
MEDTINQVARGVAVVELEDSRLPQKRVSELREELRRRNLRVTGRKHELVTRLKAALLLERDRVSDQEEGAYNDEEDDDEVEDDEDAEAADDVRRTDTGNRHRDARVLNPAFSGQGHHNDEDDDEGTDDERARYTPVTQRRNVSRRVLLTFKDVEGSLEKFSGDGHANIQRWLEDFEEMAELCGWNEIQRIAYCKRLLEGSASMFVKYERCGKTWAKLKRALKDEFEEAVDSLQVHRNLSKRKKKHDETLQQYAYIMLQIAAPANLEARAVIQYIIEGIPDDAVNKAVLYGAKNIKQLKERFGHYEMMKQEMTRSKVKPTERKTGKTGRVESQDKGKVGVPGSVAKRRCFNCGAEDHVSVVCPLREKGKKCFKCSTFGHIAAECPGKPKEVYVVSQLRKERCQQEVTIKDGKTLALVDTGSDLTLMSEGEYQRLGSPPLVTRQLCFEGVGSEVNETMGSFTTSMTAGCDDFAVEFHVVPDTILKHPVILGTDFLDRVELRIRRGETTFLKLDDDDETDVNKIRQPHIFNAINEAKEIDLEHSKEERYKEGIEKMIKEYRPETTRDVGVRAKIILNSDKPITSRPRRLAASERKEVNDLMNAWVAEGVIRPSNSEYASPIVVVRKKDGSIRVCVDYRRLKDCKFHFGAKEIEAFERLRASLINEPVLKIYWVGVDTELHTDASCLGYGMISMQKDESDGKVHPIRYANGKTTDAESRYCSYELEVLAIIKALEKFRAYSLNIPFKIVTDCQAFAATIRKEKLCLRIARWVLLLDDFKYEVVHRLGKDMSPVDALSRNSLPVIMYISEEDGGLVARLRYEHNKDEELGQIIQAKARNEADGFYLSNDLLYKNVDRKSLVVVPRSMETRVFRQTHDRGHFGINKTEALVKRQFWFEEDRKELRQETRRQIEKTQEEETAEDSTRTANQPWGMGLEERMEAVHGESEDDNWGQLSPQDGRM